MAITLGTATSSGNQVNSASFSFANTPNTNTKCLVVVVTGYDASATDSVINSVVWDSVGTNLSFTQIAAGRYRSGSGFISIWYLENPPTGTAKNITVTAAGSCTDIQATAMPLISTSSITYDTANSGDATGTPHTVTITGAATGSYAIGGIVDAADANVSGLAVTTGAEISGSEADMGSQVVGCATAATSGSTATIAWSRTAAGSSYAQAATFKEYTPVTVLTVQDATHGHAGAATTVAEVAFPISDNFNRADGDLYGAWGVFNTTYKLKVVSNQINGTSSVRCAMYYQDGRFTDNQFAECKVVGPGSNMGGGVVVRMATGAMTYYGFASSGSTLKYKLFRFNGATQTDLFIDTPTAATGDIIRLEVEGSNLRGYVNGTLVASATDANYTTGYPGAYVFGGTPYTFYVDDFRAGNIHTLAINGAAQSHVSDNATVSSASSALEVAGSAHAHASENVTVPQVHILNPDSASHPHATVNTTLTHQHILTSADASHTQTAANVTVTGQYYSIPAARQIVWQGNVGVYDDIPAQNQTIYTTLSPSGGDDNSAIQTALTNCPSGQVVALSAGTFKINGVVKVPTGKVLRGAGMGQTILQVQDTITGTYVTGFYGTGTSWNLSLNTSYDLTGTMSKGTTTIQTQSAHNWAVNDIIVIDQLNNDADDPPVTNVGVNGTATFTGRATGGRSLGQVCKITAVPDTTHATLEIPLYWDYDNTLTPQAVEMPGLTQNAGIENLTIDNSANPNANQNDGPLAFMAAINCWAYRVEVIGSHQQAIRMYQAYRCTVRGCKVHEGIPATPIDGSQYGSSHAYGIYLNPWVSACLIEFNVFYHLSNGVIMNGPVSGNVVAYNRVSDLYYTDTTWVREAISFHGAHPVMNLIEGNWTTHWLTGDFYWGSSSHNTLFRNRMAMDTGKTGGTWNIGLYVKNRYYNIVNNVIGTASHEDTYEVNGSTYSVSNGPKLIYALGYYTANGATANHDTAVASTLIRHANYDSVNAGVVWNGEDNHTISASLYLTAKPAWMDSGVNWPPVGNDVSPMYPTLDSDSTINPFGSEAMVSANSAAHAQACDNATLSVTTVELSVNSATHGQSATVGTVSQAHTLTVTGSVQTHTAGNATVAQSNHVLIVGGSAHNQTATAPTFGQVHALTNANALHGQTVGNATVATTNHVLPVNSSAHGQAADNATTSTVGLDSVSPNSSAHTHATGTATLTQQHSLTVAGSAHAHVTDNATVALIYAVTIGSAVHGHSITAHNPLRNEATHEVLYDEVTHEPLTTPESVLELQQDHVLTVASSTHAHTAVNETLSQNHVLVVNASVHAQTVGNVSFSEVAIIAVDAATHAQSAVNATLGVNVTIAAAAHAQIVADTTLAQNHLLVVDDCTHAHKSVQIYVTPQGHVYLFPNDNTLAQRAGNASVSPDLPWSDTSWPGSIPVQTFTTTPVARQFSTEPIVRVFTTAPATHQFGQ